MKQKTKTRSITKEKFNTGAHTPSSSLNVGAGYDDTGLGKYEEANEKDENSSRGKLNNKSKRKNYGKEK